MLHKTQQFLNARPVRLRTLGAVLMGFLLVGLAVASDVYRPSTTGEALSPVPPIGASTRPDSFADLAKALSPTVVHVKVTTARQVSGGQRPQMPEGPWGELYRRFFQEMPRQPEFRQGTGSGVIFRADGYILTNYHVVDGADQVLVTLNNEQEYQAHVVGRDPKTDLAVLRIQAPEALPVATLGDSDALQVGDWVVAIGNPFGLDHTVTAGIVSAKGRVIGAGPYDDFIQTDASINPGNSGGPLLNMRGEVVGINTAIVPNGQGIGFAIPINTAKPVIPQLVSTGKVTRGYLGLNMQTLTPALTQTLKLSDRKGALVSEVTPGSPAAKAGLQRGDVIVTFDGKQVESAHDLATLVAATPVGKNVSVMILRDGNKQTVPLTVGRMPSDEVQEGKAESLKQGTWGMQLQDVTPEVARHYGLKTDHGVLVADVHPGSRAAEAGLRPGDVLLEVNRQPVRSVADLQQVLAKAEEKTQFLLLVQREQGDFFVALVP